jgi:catechol 2,3-dioxygenase-like lactoylglutathione lyase family enzyme
MVLPVEIDQRSSRARAVRVRWEQVEQQPVRADNPNGETAPFTEPFFTDYAPQASRRSTPVDVQVDHADAYTTDAYTTDAYTTDAYTTDAFAGDGFAEDVIAGELVTGPGPADVITAEVSATGAPPAGPTEPPVLSGSVVYPSEVIDPADWVTGDWSDWRDGEGSERDDRERAWNGGSDEYDGPAHGIPQPRPGGDLGGPGIAPGDAGSAGEGGIDVTLIVADLARSVGFYRDLLGFALVDSNHGGAVLSYRGGLLVLSHKPGMSPVDRRVVHMHMRVSDVDATYQELRRRGVDFVHRPQWQRPGDRFDVWTALFRDPDGHAIALTQWRGRERTQTQDAPPR